MSFQSYITQVTLPIYSEGSNECTFIPRRKFLTLGKFYMYKVLNWISRKFLFRYKIPIWGHNRSQYQYHKTLKMHSETQYLKNYHYSLQAYVLVTMQHHKIYAFGLRNYWGQYKVNIRSKKVKFESLNSEMEQKCFLFSFSRWFQIWIQIFKICYIFFLIAI